MEKAINDYNLYAENKYQVWKDRFVWLKRAKDPQYRIGIMRFIRETDEIEKVIESGVPTNSNELFNTINQLADKYVAWVRAKDGSVQDYSEDDYKDMHNHFVGAMGEYFFVYLLTEVRCILSYNQHKEFARFDFRYTALYRGKDFGIDLTSIVSSEDDDMSCALQVKFWNPFEDGETPDMSVFQKLGFEAYRNEYADPKKDHNLFLCWLGDESVIYSLLSNNEPLQKAVSVIGKRSLDATVNNRNRFFWVGLFQSLADFKNAE